MFNVLNAIQISDDKWPTAGIPKSDSITIEDVQCRKLRTR